jgi:hypothetical protein
MRAISENTTSYSWNFVVATFKMRYEVVNVAGCCQRSLTLNVDHGLPELGTAQRGLRSAATFRITAMAPSFKTQASSSNHASPRKYNPTPFELV